MVWYLTLYEFSPRTRKLSHLSRRTGERNPFSESERLEDKGERILTTHYEDW